MLTDRIEDVALELFIKLNQILANPCCSYSIKYSAIDRSLEFTVAGPDDLIRKISERLNITLFKRRRR
jgi:hypothetical protein